MSASASQALAWAQRPVPRAPRRPRLLIAGAGGVLGAEVAHRLIGSGRFSQVQVLLHAPMQVALRGVTSVLVPAALQHDPPPPGKPEPAAWPPASADVAVVMFEPPRIYHQRERAFWTPTPARLASLAVWLRASGVRDLLVLVPHDTGRLPQALQRGLANLDEAAVAALGFERLLILRAARPAPARAGAGLLARLAGWMLGVAQYMVPKSQLPLRAVQLAPIVDAALALAPPGIHVLGPEVLHAAAQGKADAALRAQFGVAGAA